MKELRDKRHEEVATKKQDEGEHILNLLAENRIKKVNSEFDTNIYRNSTLQNYEWQRGDDVKGLDGEWFKAPKALGKKIYTSPSSSFLAVKGPKDENSDISHTTRLPPLEGSFILLYIFCFCISCPFVSHLVLLFFSFFPSPFFNSNLCCWLSFSLSLSLYIFYFSL